MDDYAYFQNNLTDYTKASPEAPLMNLSRAIGGNFSYVPVDCYLFADQWFKYSAHKFNSFNNNIGNFLTAFMYNLMGNSLKIKQALTNIQTD